MMTIVCAECNLEMRPVKNGQAVESMTVNGPYKLFMADRYACPTCDAQVIPIVTEPVVEHFEQDYNDVRERESPVIQYWANYREYEAYWEKKQQ